MKKGWVQNKFRLQIITLVILSVLILAVYAVYVLPPVPDRPANFIQEEDGINPANFHGNTTATAIHEMDAKIKFGNSKSTCMIKESGECLPLLEFAAAIPFNIRIT